MGAAIIIWLIGLFIFFFILYNVIQSALDNTTMARNIQEIRDLLSDLKLDKPVANNPELSMENDDERYEDCPACSYKVKRNESICPDCGLKLID